MAEISDFIKRVDAMCEEDREHFREVINAVSHCYSQEGRKAIVIIDTQDGYLEALTINCDDAEAALLARASAQYLDFVSTEEAPPKDKLN